MEIYTTGMLACAGADGFDQREEDWVLGHQACFGVPAEIFARVDELKKVPVEDVVKKLKEHPKLVATRGVFLWHCLCASAADGALTRKEIDATKKYAVALGKDEAFVDKLVNAYHAEQKLRMENLNLIWEGQNPWEKK